MTPTTPTMTVVSGAASGIGRATVLLLGRAGYRVAVLDQDGAGADRTAREVLAAGAAAAAGFSCDVTSPSAVGAALDAAVSTLDAQPTGLFTSAGVDLGGPAHLLDVADWRTVLDVNLTGSFLLARAVIVRLLEAGAPGSIVLCSSPAATVAFAAGGGSAYAASKGGVSALVRTLAVDYAPRGIRVNAIVPGSTETPLMWAGVAPPDQEGLRAILRAEIPLGRLADPEEPARAALWLLGPDSSYVTGSHLVCDGGVLAKAAVSR